MTTNNNNELKSFDFYFKKLCGKLDKYVVWDDFIHIFSYEIACGLGNNVDRLKNKYLSVMKRISDEQKELYCKMFAAMVAELEKDPYQDYLGTKYQKLGLNDAKNKAQIFTPIEVSKLMARLSSPKEEMEKEIESKGYITLDDSAIGAGSTIIGALETYKNDYDINYQKYVWVTGRDLSEISLLACYIQLALLGAAGVLTCGNTLTLEDEFSLTLPGQFLQPEWALHKKLKLFKQVLNSGPESAHEQV